MNSPADLNPPRCYYKVLNVESNATIEQISKAYKNLAKLYHPDKNKLEGAKSKFQELEKAHRILTSEADRRTYDAAKTSRIRNQSQNHSTPTTTSFRYTSNGAGQWTHCFGLANVVINGQRYGGDGPTTNNVPPNVTSPTGGKFTTSEDGRSFTTSESGHTYILDGPQGTLNWSPTFTSSGDRVKILARGTSWTVITTGNDVRVTASGFGTKVRASGDYAFCEASGTGTHFRSTGNQTKCSASGAGVTFIASGNDVHCDASGAGVTFTASGNDVHCDASGAGVTFISSGNDVHCDASGAGVTFVATGKNAHCDASGVGVTFKTSDDSATYSCSGVGFKLVRN